MHGIGHWLGLDVHDIWTNPSVERVRPFVPGMVLTVEPGLYIQPYDTEVEEKWRGIGIRIEDDVVVTEQDSAVLSALAPSKSVRGIECGLF